MVALRDGEQKQEDGGFQRLGLALDAGRQQVQQMFRQPLLLQQLFLVAVWYASQLFTELGGGVGGG